MRNLCHFWGEDCIPVCGWDVLATILCSLVYSRSVTNRKPVGPKESSLGLHCTSVQSWGSFFLRVLAGIGS